MKYLYSLCFLILIILPAKAQSTQEIFEFEYEGVVLNGILNLPEGMTPKGIVLMVHGSGRTNAVAGNLHGDVRNAITKAGYATYIWDKMGCGKSGGTFDYNQTVQSSASEAIAAIHALKEKQVPSSNIIGLWGISRAGWINPIIINQYKDIKFWVSVSGVDDKENFKYLLEENLRINGLPKDSIDLIVNEWQQGVLITHSGKSYETYKAATSNLKKNKFWSRFLGGGEITEEGYYTYQKGFMKETLDKETGLQVYIDNFDSLLSNIKIPVLALFGAKDMNVDYQKTISLYASTLAKNTDLTIQTFPDGNHNLFQCKTGGFYEFQDNNLPWNRCEGFLESITNWVKEIE